MFAEVGIINWWQNTGYKQKPCSAWRNWAGQSVVNREKHTLISKYIIKQITQEISMEQDELKAHRKWIQIQIAVMRQKFFMNHMQPQVYEAFMLSWADALQDYSQEEISKAIAQYISQSPKIAPNEGHIRQIIMKNRPRIKPVPKEPEPEKELPTIEERKKIAASLGLKVVP